MKRVYHQSLQIWLDSMFAWMVCYPISIITGSNVCFDVPIILNAIFFQCIYFIFSLSYWQFVFIVIITVTVCYTKQQQYVIFLHFQYLVIFYRDYTKLGQLPYGSAVEPSGIAGARIVTGWSRWIPSSHWTNSVKAYNSLNENWQTVEQEGVVMDVMWYLGDVPYYSVSSTDIGINNSIHVANQ